MEKWIMRRLHLATFALALIPLICPLICLSGCQQPETKKTRMLLDWLPNPNHVPLYFGQERGIFQKHGIDLELLKISDPSESLAFLATRTVDLALYYMPETYMARRRGARLAIVGYLIRVPLNAFIYRRNEGISNIADLHGKKIGYCVGDFNIVLLKKILKENQIVPSALYNVSFDLVGSLALRHVDVLYGAYWNIEGEHLRSLGVENDYFGLDKFSYPTYDELLVISCEGAACSSPDFIAAFRSALQESIDAAIAHPDKAFEAYARANPDKGDKTLEWERRAWSAPLLFWRAIRRMYPGSGKLLTNG